MLKEKNLLEAYRTAIETSKNQSQIVNFITDWLNYHNSDSRMGQFDPFIDAVFEEKDKIKSAFLDYFIAYANMALRNLSQFKDEPTVSNLIPCIYLMHHSVELFVKYIKFEIFSFFKRSPDGISPMLPANIRDLRLDRHNIIGLLNESDCTIWFSYISNGEKLRELLLRRYNLVCELLDSTNLAEDMRFPIGTKSYIPYNYDNFTENNLIRISELAFNVIALCVLSFEMWIKKEDIQEARFIEDVTKSWE